MENWYIGQDIVCIKTHSVGLVKEGNTFTIKGLREGFCKCYKTLINVGVSHPNSTGMVGCNICNNGFQAHGIAWFDEKLFAPLDTLCNISELTEILTEPIFK